MEGSSGSPQRQSDVFFVDLHKAERDYSPTTMYRDYAINRELFHWESQSRQTIAQPTVQRYINHPSWGHTVLLFVRERKRFELGDAAFTFSGPARLRRPPQARVLSRSPAGPPKPMPEAFSNRSQRRGRISRLGMYRLEV